MMSAADPYHPDRITHPLKRSGERGFVGAHRCLACGYVGTGGVMFGTSNLMLPSDRDDGRS